jgi:membrane protein implicated in regulation of membrane protease activity
VIVMATLALAEGNWPNPAADTALAPLGIFFFLSACAGLILAWLLEGSGGMLAIFGVAALYLTSLVATGRLPAGWLLSVAALNGFLFILARALHAVLSHEASSDGDPSPGTGRRDKLSSS